MPQTTTATGAGLFDRLNAIATAEAKDREALQKVAQLAICVEFTTIPAYLTALYSITDPSSQAYQWLRSVVMEEMFHVNQAANLCVAVGGAPRFTGAYAPTYPNHLPQANPATTPIVGLFRATPEVFEDVFAAIETPAPADAPPQGDNYDTIAQLYEAAAVALKAFGPDAYGAAPGYRQRTDIYPGKFGGKPVEVVDFATAALGITEVVQQGEGSVPEGQPMDPRQPWDCYNHYGIRSDGTYGPITGTPYEMSHFKKFRSIALDTATFPDSLPIISNPTPGDISNDVAKAKLEVFDALYSVLLLALEATFKVQPAGAPDPFFAVAMPIMHHALPKLARSLMTTPANKKGSGSVGPNAAPTFLYRDGVGVASVLQGVRNLAAMVEAQPKDADRDEDLRLLRAAAQDLGMLTGAAGALSL